MLGIDLRHIKDIREDHDLSQKELAKILNISQHTHTTKMEPERFPLMSWSNWLIFMVVPQTIYWDAQRRKTKPPLHLHRTGMVILTTAMPAQFPQSDSFIFPFISQISIKV